MASSIPPAPRPLRQVVPRLSRQNEVLLALLPTATVLSMLVFLRWISNQQLLFASLASSAFLIYLDPTHRANSTWTLVVSQLGAASLGALCHGLLGPGYLGAGVALILTIAMMLAFDTLHPPAVATALNFAFRTGTSEGNWLLFALAVGLIVVLLGLQRASVWCLARFSHAEKIRGHARGNEPSSPR